MHKDKMNFFYNFLNFIFNNLMHLFRLPRESMKIFLRNEYFSLFLIQI